MGFCTRYSLVRLSGCILFFLFSPFSLFGQSQKLSIGVCTDNGAVIDSQTGQNFNSLFLSRFQDIAGHDYTFYFDNYDNCISRFESGDFDVVLGVPEHAEIGRPHHFLMPVYTVHYNTIIAKLDNRSLVKGDIQALDELQIGIITSSFTNLDLLSQFEEQYGISFDKYFYETEMELNSDFESGVIPLKLSFNNTIADNEKVIWNFGYTPYYVLCAETKEELQNDFSEVVQKVFKDSMFELTQMQMLVSNFELFSAPNILPHEAEYLKQLPSIYINNLRLWSYVCNYLSKLSGLHFFDLKDADGNFENKLVLQIKPVTPSTSFVNATQISNPVVVAQHWLIPAPSENPNDFLLTSSESTPKKTICLVSDVDDVIPFYITQLKPFTIVYFKSYADCLEAVSEHVCDATIMPSFLLGATYNLSEYPKLKNSTFHKLLVPYHFVVLNPEYKGLVHILNKFIAGFSPEFLETSGIQELSKAFPYVPSRSVKRRQLLFITIVFAVLATLGYLAYLLRRNQLFRHWAYTDELTGMWNVRRFHEEAERMMKQHPDWNFAVIDSDIRGFKYINKIYGPEEGDKALRFYSGSLMKYRLDNMLVAHGYADRFLMMFRIESMDDCAKKCMDLFFQCNADAAVHGFHYVIKDGVAVAGKDFGKQSIQNLVGRAGYAKLTIKQDLVNGIAFFDDKMEKQSLYDQQVEQYITQAFDKEELYVVYQPKVDLLTGKIAGAEALVRWNSPELGLLMPDTFMPVLERDGYIIKLDFYVYRKVFEFIESIIEKGIPMVPISVNMSRFHLNVPNFIEKFTSLFAGYHIPPELIEVEVIERASGQNDTMIINITRQLQQAGFHVAMDDFGNAESSLNMLHTIPVDILKLDKNFLYRSEDTNDSRIIITKVIEMAQGLGKRTVCEGVETQQQVDFLKTVGCNQAQGYYYYHPMDGMEFVKLLTQS